MITALVGLLLSTFGNVKIFSINIRNIIAIYLVLSFAYIKNMKYVKNSNLPEGKVSLVAISSQAGESIKKLNSKDIKTIIIHDNPLLPEPVKSHADLQILHMGNNVIFCQNEHLCIGESQSDFNMHIIKESAGNKYPDDVRLNCTIIGNKIICNEKYIIIQHIMKN